MNNFTLSDKSRSAIEAYGMFSLSPVIHSMSFEWAFEDHADKGRRLSVFDTGIAIIHTGYQDTSIPVLVGAVRVDTEQELLALLNLTWG